MRNVDNLLSFRISSMEGGKFRTPPCYKTIKLCGIVLLSQSRIVTQISLER